MRTAIKFLLLAGLFFAIGEVQGTEAENPQIPHPGQYIKITDFRVYSARGVGIIHHVAIENTSGSAYKDIKVLVRYHSRGSSNYGTIVAVERGILPVTVPPRSKAVYLQGGSVFGAISGNFYAGSIEVLSATRVSE